MQNKNRTQDALLTKLLATPEQPISGQALADALGVSRMAVSKAAAALQKQGWQISAASGRGYCLHAGSDALTESALRTLLSAENCKAEPVVYATVDSTNTAAKRLAVAGAPHGTLVVAGEQTGGRGRLGRSFVSPAGTGLYMSLLLRPDMTTERAQRATFGAAVAVCQAVESLCGIRLQIKWVNDLYRDKRKVCGILTEAAASFESGRLDYLVVGIGLNITTGPEAFGLDLAETAGSLYPGGASPVSRAALAAAITTRLLALCPAFDCLPEYRERSMVPGHWVSVTPLDGSPAYTARALNIDDDGRLIVQLPSGAVQTLAHAEVSIRPAPIL